MVDSKYLVAGLVPAGVFIGLTLILYAWWLRRRQKAELTREDPNNQLRRTSQLHQLPDLEIVSRSRRPYNSVYPRGVLLRNCRFNWDDHPSLVHDAVENGWSQFVFTNYMSSPSSSASSARSRRVMGLYMVNHDHHHGGKDPTAVEISWEVYQGSADFMQKIGLNNNKSGLKKPPIINIRTALPLPGPPLASFPQEAYFEITILTVNSEINSESSGLIKEGEKMKLIHEMNGNPKMSSSGSSLIPFVISKRGSSNSNNNGTNVEEEEGEAVISIGLSIGGPINPSKLPGSYPGSIGFNSNGSVFLDGMKLVFESEKEEWGRKEKVIGCGYDPRDKKVFFTLDSELVHVINCKSQEFGSPLYPTIAANSDITVIVNMGQSLFRYGPAQRTPNPCFVGIYDDDGARVSYEDSRELFSVGMLSSSCYTLDIDHKAICTDADSADEIDLFEIDVVDNTR